MSVTFQPRGIRTTDESYGSLWTNFANANARRVLCVAGLLAHDEDLYGVCPVAQLPGVAQRLVRALNASEVYTREASESQEPGRCRVIDCGTTDEVERRRYHALLCVVRACIEHGADLTWG